MIPLQPPPPPQEKFGLFSDLFLFLHLSLPLSPCEASQMQSSDRGPESLRTENNGAVHSSVSQEWLDFKGQRAKMLVEDHEILS